MDWQPDAADLGSRGNIQVKNAVPSADGYQPFPSLNVITTAIDAFPRGGIEAYDASNDSHLYVGDATKLYEFNNNLTWDNVTRSSGGNYATGDGEIWNFARWENKVIATNFSDNPQEITMGATNFSQLTSLFRARNVAVVGDFVVFSNTWDATDGNVPNRLRWSGIGDETTYTVSATTLSDFRDLPTGGPIQKVVGGEVGIIVSDRSVWRMQFVGAPTVFQTDEILPDVGAICAGGITSIGDSVFFISSQGFVELTGNGTGINYIGAGRVDRFFQNDFDADYPHKVFSISDPTANRVVWCYPGAGSTAGRPNKIIVYDRTFNKWSLIEEETEMVVRTRGIDLTLDELEAQGFTDIDTMTVSLDSPQFKVLSTQLAAFDSTFKLGFYRGSNKTAVLETGEMEFNPGYYTDLNAFTPLVDGGTVTAEVGYRKTQQSDVVYTSQLSLNSEGVFNTLLSQPYYRIRLTVSGDDWTDAMGVQVERKDAPRAGARG